MVINGVEVEGELVPSGRAAEGSVAAQAILATTKKP